MNMIINIIGIGHNGCNVVSQICKKNMNVSLTICDAYEESLKDSLAEKKILLEKGGDVINSKSINKILNGGEYITLLIAHMDNNISIQGIRKIAKVSKEIGRLTIAIISMPSQIEGNEVAEKAQKGYEELKEAVDAVFTTERPYGVKTIEDYFEAIEKTLEEYAVCISQMITIPGLTCFDWGNFKTMMKDAGDAYLAIGYGEGAYRAKSAIDNTVDRLHRSGHDINKAQRIIVFIIYKRINTHKMRNELEALDDFMNKYDDQVEIKWGLLTDETLGEKTKVEIIGCEKAMLRK